jgi:hypothetical protein
MSTIIFDIEVAFHPEITKMCMERGLDEKKFSWNIEAGMRYVSHISYKIGNQPVVDLSLLDYKGSLVGDTNEVALLKDFAKAYNRCDESVAHYGSKFDIKFLNSRIAKAGLPPLKPVKLRDTWRILKDKFALSSNRLDTAIQFFNCPFGKPSLQWSVWREVSLGNVKAHKLLRHRCHYDVLSLDWIYHNKLRVYDTGSVNRALAYDLIQIDDTAIASQLKAQLCANCLKIGTYKREGFHYGKSATKIQLSCKACFSWATAPIKPNGSLGRIR